MTEIERLALRNWIGETEHRANVNQGECPTYAALLRKAAAVVMLELMSIELDAVKAKAAERRDAYGLDSVCLCGHKSVDHVDGKARCVAFGTVEGYCGCTTFQLVRVT